MNVREALAHARKALHESNIEDASLEGEILVRLATGLNRTRIFSSYDNELTPIQNERLKKLIERRLTGEPSAYITGRKEFYGLDFKVDPSVLIPRPETELLVEKAIELIRQYRYSTIADIGTGSGCIAISIAEVQEKVTIWATDQSPEALQTAKSNIDYYRLSERIQLVPGKLLEPLTDPVDMIIANLPYVKTEEANLPFEPRAALDGGKDGLDVIKELIKQLPGKLKAGGALLLEIGQGQADEVKSLLLKEFPGSTVEVYKDLAGIDRSVVMRLTA